MAIVNLRRSRGRRFVSRRTSVDPVLRSALRTEIAYEFRCPAKLAADASVRGALKLRVQTGRWRLN